MATFPLSYCRFIELFNARRFFESHEVLEQAWLVNKSRFYKGMIIYASAFVHLQRGNAAGAAKQFNKVYGYLSTYRPCYMGLNVDFLIEHIDQSLCRLDAVMDDSEADREQGMAVTIPRLILRRSLCRGDEPELHQSGQI